LTTKIFTISEGTSEFRHPIIGGAIAGVHIQ
jgi:hypothetical protein